MSYGLSATLAILAFTVPSLAYADDPVGFSLYGDTQYGAVRAGGATTNAFQAAQLDTYYHGAVDRLSYLAEVVFEVDSNPADGYPAFNSFAPDVERLQISYQFAEWLKLSAGRFHTAFGYYNDAYHHGAYYILSPERPKWVNFEDSGGLIPAHSVGIHADGRVEVGSDHIRYDFEVANGRGQVLDNLTNLVDYDNSKAFNLRLRWEPSGALDGLVVGANGYIDTIPASTAMPIKMNEQIIGAHVAYLENNLHLISEFAYFRHAQDGGPSVFNTYAFFAEGGYSIGDFTPFVRYEQVNFAANHSDPFFAPSVGAQGDYKTYLLGVNYLALEHAILKLQTGISQFENASTSYSVLAQCAYQF